MTGSPLEDGGNSDYEIITVSEDLQFVKKRGSPEFFAAFKNGVFMEQKDWTDEMKQLAHATSLKYRCDFDR